MDLGGSFALSRTPRTPQGSS
ncbi:Protein of unknown function [Pyronema omphalodes CBS 100304]|uniref:Uncharacterized protein n=1 Tax=Pyronema omphalodes (strain CBS 100304) TaxID=1076935 RepID=U4KX86_PYROM|nr:Protein of unknown function [Pyronema omphalodes CBS 100304]